MIKGYLSVQSQFQIDYLSHKFYQRNSSHSITQEDKKWILIINNYIPH